MASGRGATKARQVAYLVQDLVYALAPNTDGEDEQQQESGGGMTPAQQELYEYCMLILGSRMGDPLSKDEFNVAELIKKKLSAGGDTTKAIRFAKLFNQLQNVSVLSDNWRVLYLLYSLMGSGNADDHSSFCLPLRSFAAASTTETPPISSREAPLRTKSASDATSQRAVPERETLHRSSSQNLSYEVDPSVLVFDTLYCFQNIEGLHIKWDTEHDCFAIPNEVGIQAPVRQLVSHMCEAGWLCRHIRQRLQTSQEAATSSGLVLQSFHTGVEDEINAWERAVAEAQVQVRSSNHNPEDITLRRIRAWMTGYLSHLKNLSLLVDVDTTKSIQQKATKGGALTSRLYAMHHHGDPSMRRLAKRLLRHAARPLFGMIQRWVTRGVLEDPFAEFFVAEDRAVPLPRLWYDRYAVRESMVPAFMDSALVNKIFLIGKSINFIRECCDERQFSVDELWRSLTNNDSNHQKFMPSLKKSFSSIPSSSSSFFVEDVDVAFGASSSSSSLRNTISSIGVAVSKQLLQLLFEKYKFREHCTAIKRYLLLGQGDFIHYLMKLMRDALSKPATNLYRHNLSGILERAIQGSYAQYEHEDIRERLDVRLLPTISLSNNEKEKQEPSSSPSTSVIEGWDVFSLDYHVSGPVDTVFTVEAMESYYQIFNFLWQLKRVYFGLTTSWQKDMMMTSFASSRTKTKKRASEGQRGGRRGKWKEEEDDEEENENDDEEQETRRKKNELRHKCNLLRQRMLHFVSNVQFYAMGEVVDIEWEKLQQRMEEATELPELIDAHNAFLGSVSARLFQQQTSSQTTPSSQLLPLLKKLFDIILRSLGIFESLSSTSSSPSSSLESSALRLKSITNEYEQTLLLFVTALQSAQKEQRIFEHLHPLCLRLSFNDYHPHH